MSTLFYTVIGNGVRGKLSVVSTTVQLLVCSQQQCML